MNQAIGSLDAIPYTKANNYSIFLTTSFLFFWRSAALQLNSFDDISRHHRHIFLSPHFDDAVYSCGGTIGVQVSAGLRPLVITVFGGAPASPVEFSPFAAEIHRTMGFRQDAQAAVAARRRE